MKLMLEVAGGIVLAWLFLVFVLPLSIGSMYFAWRQRRMLSVIALIIGALFGMFAAVDAQQYCYQRVLVRCW